MTESQTHDQQIASFYILFSFPGSMQTATDSHGKARLQTVRHCSSQARHTRAAVQMSQVLEQPDLLAGSACCVTDLTVSCR